MKSPRQLRSASHWGAFRIEVDRGVICDVAPFEFDPAPSPLLRNAVEMAYAPNRVLKPAVRAGWLKGDGGAGRGQDDFIEIGWDEALDIVAAQLARTRKLYGDAAVFGGSYGWASAGRVHHARGLLHRFLAAGGGFTGQETNYSYGAAMAFIPHVVGKSEGMNSPLTPLAQVAENARIILAFGGLPAKNWEVQSGGSGVHALPGHLHTLTQNGVRVITVSPFRDDSPDIPGAEFISIRPTTDCALILALIHILITENLHDRAFLATYTSGFETLEAYVMGTSDGVPKTPAWASAITGIPAEMIAGLARDLARQPSMITATWSLQRAANGEQPFWAIISLASALGRIGLPGQGFGFGYGSINGMGDAGYRTPLSGVPSLPNPVTSHIPVARITDMLMNSGQGYRYNFQTRNYPDIRLIYWAGGNPFHHHQDLNRLSTAFRKPDFVAVHEIIWNGTARHSDIVLPATTALERNDIGGSSRDPFILAMHRAINPMGDARNDYDIFAALAERLGYRKTFTEGRTTDDWVKRQWERSRATLAGRGIDTPDFETFWEQGYFRMPEPKRMKTRLEDFRADPEANPVETATGRIMLSLPKVGEEGLPPHAAWLGADEYLGSALASRYPLHLLTPQPPGRLHSQGGLSTASGAHRRNGYEILRINPKDARDREIADDDVVEVFNDRGVCMAVAALDPGLCEGVVRLPPGADYLGSRRAVDPVSQLDRGSNPNILTRDVGTSALGQGCTAQSCLVDVSLVQRSPNPDPAATKRMGGSLPIGRMDMSGRATMLHCISSARTRGV